MKVEDIRKIAVVGAGTMGHSITWLCAKAEYPVNMVDVKQEILDNAFSKITKIPQLLVKNHVMSESEANDALSRIKPYVNLAGAVDDVDFVFEAVPPGFDLKKKVYPQLDELCPKHAIITLITSSMTADMMAPFTKRPDKIIGMMFFNPPHLMPIVEVGPGSNTSQETLNVTLGLLKKLGKEPIVLKKTLVGFISSRLNRALQAEALALVRDGVASFEDIDEAVKRGSGIKASIIAVFIQMDLSGLDTVLDSFMNVYKETGNPSYVPAIETLREKVKKNELGVKTGKGFYDYKGKTLEDIITSRDECLIKFLMRKQLR